MDKAPGIAVGGLAGAIGGSVLGGLSGRAAGKALNKDDKSARAKGRKTGLLVGGGLGALAAHKGKPTKAGKLFQYGDKMNTWHGRMGYGALDRAKDWGHFAGRAGKAYLPELAAGALGAALLARSKSKKKKMEKEAISKAWLLESKPGRASVGKALSMLNGHRNQIANSDPGLAGSILSRHKKVKQSIGDATKLAFTKADLALIPAGAAVGALSDKDHRARNAAIGAGVGGVAGIRFGLGSKIREALLKMKTGMLDTQMLNNPQPPSTQQSWRGRPPKPKDTTTVPTAMMDTAAKLSPPETIA